MFCTDQGRSGTWTDPIPNDRDDSGHETANTQYAEDLAEDGEAEAKCEKNENDSKADQGQSHDMTVHLETAWTALAATSWKSAKNGVGPPRVPLEHVTTTAPGRASSGAPP
jgi:hypothetical protein